MSTSECLKGSVPGTLLELTSSSIKFKHNLGLKWNNIFLWIVKFCVLGHSCCKFWLSWTVNAYLSKRRKGIFKINIFNWFEWRGETPLVVGTHSSSKFLLPLECNASGFPVIVRRLLKKLSDKMGKERVILRTPRITSMLPRLLSSSWMMLSPPLICISRSPSIVVHPRNFWTVSMLLTNDPLHSLGQGPNRNRSIHKLSFLKLTRKEKLKSKNLPWHGTQVKYDRVSLCCLEIVLFCSWNPGGHSYLYFKKKTNQSINQLVSRCNISIHLKNPQWKIPFHTKMHSPDSPKTFQFFLT